MKVEKLIKNLRNGLNSNVIYKSCYGSDELKYCKVCELDIFDIKIDGNYIYITVDNLDDTLDNIKQIVSDEINKHLNNEHIVCVINVDKTEITVKLSWEDKSIKMLFRNYAELTEICLNFIETIKEEITMNNKTILNDKEKNYLLNIVAPKSIYNNVHYIVKRNSKYYKDKYYINIKLTNGEVVSLPKFTDKKMYQGMEFDKFYTLEELDLSKDV